MSSTRHLTIETCRLIQQPLGPPQPKLFGGRCQQWISNNYWCTCLKRYTALQFLILFVLCWVCTLLQPRGIVKLWKFFFLAAHSYLTNTAIELQGQSVLALRFLLLVSRVELCFHRNGIQQYWFPGPNVSTNMSRGLSFISNCNKVEMRGALWCSLAWTIIGSVLLGRVALTFSPLDAEFFCVFFTRWTFGRLLYLVHDCTAVYIAPMYLKCFYASRSHEGTINVNRESAQCNTKVRKRNIKVHKATQTYASQHESTQAQHKSTHTRQQTTPL